MFTSSCSAKSVRAAVGTCTWIVSSCQTKRNSSFLLFLFPSFQFASFQILSHPPSFPVLLPSLIFIHLFLIFGFLSLISFAIQFHAEIVFLLSSSSSSSFASFHRRSLCPQLPIYQIFSSSTHHSFLLPCILSAALHHLVLLSSTLFICAANCDAEPRSSSEKLTFV